MGNQQQNESKASANESQRNKRQAQQRHDAHTNSARAGENQDLADDSGDDESRDTQPVR